MAGVLLFVLLLTVLADDEDLDAFDDLDDFVAFAFRPAFAGSPDVETGKPIRTITARQTAMTVLSP